jgi:ubiquinone/menaquinone biosynthesis C-methylase UbiE
MPKLNDAAWNKIAAQFDRWMETDDYPEKLVEKIKVNPKYTVLDIGCGNGAITIPIAKKVNSVTAIDMSDKMLHFLRKNALEEDLSNITYINGILQDIEIDDKYDVVIASRSLNGVSDIKKELEKIDNAAKKYVYITLWGVNARGFEKKMYEVIGREFQQHPDYMYVYNILHQMGIYANIEMLECKMKPSYANLEETIDFLKWRIADLNEEEEILIKNYLIDTMIENKGMLEYLYDKSDWVLIWWRK